MKALAFIRHKFASIGMSSDILSAQVFFTFLDSRKEFWPGMWGRGDRLHGSGAAAWRRV